MIAMPTNPIRSKSREILDARAVLFGATGKWWSGHIRRRGERVAGNHRVAELAEKIADGAGGMRDEHRVGSVVGGDFFQRVEILGYQDELHNVVRRGARHSFGKILD